MSQNLELKATCADLARVREAFLGLGAEPVEVMRHVDTYFRVSSGRLKLRTIDESQAELIAYHRPNEARERVSRFRLLPVEDPAGMLDVLTDTLGVLCTVVKRRELMMWEATRIHLDQVETLGSYVEFEALLDVIGCIRTAKATLETLLRVSATAEEDVIGCSYSDLLLGPSTVTDSGLQSQLTS